jgi:hypothetical protein
MTPCSRLNPSPVQFVVNRSPVISVQSTQIGSIYVSFVSRAAPAAEPSDGTVHINHVACICKGQNTELLVVRSEFNLLIERLFVTQFHFDPRPESLAFHWTIALRLKIQNVQLNVPTKPF